MKNLVLFILCLTVVCLNRTFGQSPNALSTETKGQQVNWEAVIKTADIHRAVQSFDPIQLIGMVSQLAQAEKQYQGIHPSASADGLLCLAYKTALYKNDATALQQVRQAATALNRNGLTSQFATIDEDWKNNPLPKPKFSIAVDSQTSMLLNGQVLQAERAVILNDGSTLENMVQQTITNPYQLNSKVRDEFLIYLLTMKNRVSGSQQTTAVSNTANSVGYTVPATEAVPQNNTVYKANQTAIPAYSSIQTSTVANQEPIIVQETVRNSDESIVYTPEEPKYYANAKTTKKSFFSNWKIKSKYYSPNFRAYFVEDDIGFRVTKIYDDSPLPTYMTGSVITHIDGVALLEKEELEKHYDKIMLRFIDQENDIQTVYVNIPDPRKRTTIVVEEKKPSVGIGLVLPIFGPPAPAPHPFYGPHPHPGPGPRW